MNPGSSHMKARIVDASLERLRRFRIGRRTVGPDLPDQDLDHMLHQLDALLVGPERGLARGEMAALRKGITALAPRHLTSTRPDGRLLAPVANVHLANGAGIRWLNRLAIPGPEGLGESLGLMVDRGDVPTSDAVRPSLLT